MVLGKKSYNNISKLESNRGAYAKFKIVSVKFDGEHSFPRAHTCFNRLDLPLYIKYNNNY